MDIFVAVIVTTNTSKKRTHDIALRRSARDRGIARIFQKVGEGGGGVTFTSFDQIK